MSKWKLLTLRDICQATQGVQIPKNKQINTEKKGFKRYFYISDFTHDKKTKYVEDKYPKKNFTTKDLIVSNTGSHGEIFRGKEGILSNNLFKVTIDEKVVNDNFLVYFLKSNLFKNFQSKRVRGTANPHMGHKNFLDTPINLPPLSEQKQIVTKLDASFAEIDKIINLKKEKIIKEKDLDLSALKLIFSTIKSKKNIGEIATVIAGQSPEGKYYNKNAKGLPFYQGKKEFGKHELKKPVFWTTKTTKEAHNGDVLMSVRAPVGETNMCNSKICIGRGLAAIRANKDYSPEFIYYFLKTIKNQIVGNTGAVFNSINKKQIEEIEIASPNLKTQNEMTNKIKILLSYIEEMNFNSKLKLNNLNILKSSILKQELEHKAA